MEPIKLFSPEEATRCYNCGKPLGNQRCAGNTPNGPKWFCRQEPDSNPFESCYSHWRMRQSRQASWRWGECRQTTLAGDCVANWCAHSRLWTSESKNT